MGIIIGIVLILAVTAFFAVMTCKSKHSDLFRWLLIAIFAAICITWVVPYGYFNGSTYGEVAMKRIGLSDLPSLLYYAAYFGLTTIIYLFKKDMINLNEIILNNSKNDIETIVKIGDNLE